jgi:DNA-binding CsgD family transcriptional regulator
VGWWAGWVAGSVGFVGRESELSRLLGAVDGDTRVLLVVGDAGVGKTRFVTEGARRAADGGVTAVWGGCLPLAEKLPLLPVAGALGELSRVDDGRLVQAGLGAAPAYLRGEVERLVPWLGRGTAVPADLGGGWRRERLFSAVGDLLGAVAARRPMCMVIEDVHWADSSTLDFLTFLCRAGGLGAVTLVVTCRSDEAPLDPLVADWLAHVRGGRRVEEIRLAPLSEVEAAELVAGLLGAPKAAQVANELYARAEGNPFFTEQLVAAMLADSAQGGLPAGLAELLAARAARCAGDARAVLDALAVAGRPLTEDQLAAVSGMGVEAVRRGLRELAAARLLADGAPGGRHRPRHALVAEAVAAGLLPGERAGLHESTARALAVAGDPALAAEVAGHWQAAGRHAEELPARVAAAKAAERVFGYAEAAAHWQRAIELAQGLPGAAGAAGVSLPQLYVQAIDAAEISGNSQRAGLLAEEAHQRYADHTDRATAAAICRRAGYLRGLQDPDAGCPLIEKALELFEQEPPSAEHAEALVQYANIFLLHAYGRREDSRVALTRALEVAEAAGATIVIPRILAFLGEDALLRGQVQEAFATLRRGRAVAEATGNDAALMWLAASESFAFLTTGSFSRAEEVALRGLHAARQAGLGAWYFATTLAEVAAEAMLAGGRTADAAELIDPLTTGPPRHDDLFMHVLRSEIDLLRGDIEASATRQQQVTALAGHFFGTDLIRQAAQRTVEVALWAGLPGDALQEVRRVLALYGVHSADLTLACGETLAAGLRACADLAERARARRDHDAARAAEEAARQLASWLERMQGVPFTDHPYAARIPADRATWEAEWTRLAGASDPGMWHAAAKTWQSLGRPHGAGYAWWRHAQAQLDAGQPPTAAATALRAAAVAAGGHAPLLAQVCALAERTRISLPRSTAAVPPPAEVPAPYGLTERELAVLRLLAAGRTNTQIGAELYISPTTARVHVSNILRKLGVSNRVQAAALAERAGLLDPGQG